MSKSLVETGQLLAFIEAKLSQNGVQDVKKPLIYVENLIKNFQTDSSKSVENLVNWAQSVKTLKVSSNPVPLNTLPNATLHDIRVFSRGPDDFVYDKSREIRAKIARGNSVLEYKNSENGQTTHDLIIYALRKFTGGLGDEDDVDRNTQDWKKYFLKDLESTRRVIAMRKANGEAAHMSCRFIDGQFFICAGSKNVHLIFQRKSDIEKYIEERFTVARVVCQTIEKFLANMEPDLKQMFLSFLCLTKLTVIFEILNPNTQHVEDLSYLDEPLLKYITFCESKIIENPTSLCVMPPDYCIQIANIFGLSCVEFETMAPNQVDEFLVKTRKDHGHEGYVLYFLDADENVIGLLKKKTVWYIIVRAIREKVRSFMSKKSSQNVEDTENKIKGRLTSIQKWIGFGDEELKSWLDLSIKFVRWFSNGVKTNKISLDDFNQKYPVLWTKFLSEQKLSDKIELNLQKESLSTLSDVKVEVNNDEGVDELARELQDL